MIRPDAHQLGPAVALLMAAMLSACAIPATEVAVPTMPMRQALEMARTEAGGRQIGAQEGLGPMPAEAPRPASNSLLSAPDVRLAYLYEWVDATGIKHYGEWVAIPIAGYRWIMSDGTRAPLDTANHESPPMPEGR